MIEIVDYQERWPSEFAALGAELRRALGDLALRIDHIGSTSVPGLAAKDRIDVQVTIADEQGFEPALDRLEAAGFGARRRIATDHVPPEGASDPAEWVKRFATQRPGERAANIHIRARGRANQRYPLLFRDYLRAHAASATAYARLKRELAARLSDVDTYAEVKDPACDLIIIAAESWAAATGWRLGPSDA